MASIPAGAWVLVGDGEKALFLRNDGDDTYPNLTVVREETNDDTAKPGTPGATKVVDEVDFTRIEKAHFAKAVAERLYKAAHRGEYQKLIVAAPPVVLGELRKAWHKEVESRLLFDVAKELTNRPVDEIESVLKAA
jgi:protein required for attachment to host cells